MAAALLSPQSAFAAETKNAEFHVTIRIKPVCEVVTATGGLSGSPEQSAAAGADIDFGEYFSNHTSDVTGQSKAGGGNGITLKCTTGTPYKIGLTPETENDNSGGGKMNGLATTGAAGNKIAYKLYQDEARNQAWGDVDGKMLSGEGRGFSTPINIPVYGKVAGSELNKPAGRYNDKVTVTVHY